jgi:hypothetical protein
MSAWKSVARAVPAMKNNPIITPAMHLLNLVGLLIRFSFIYRQTIVENEN